MRITEKHGTKYVIPLRKLSAAADKLARYEDTGLEPEQLIEMDRLYSEKCAEVGNLQGRLNHMKTETLKFLDEVDGLITDDPISEVREKLEEVMK